MKAPSATTVGLMGGGQLAKMLAIAAARMGLRTIVYTPDKEAPALQVTSDAMIGDYADQETLARFADAVDVITCEFENVPAHCLQFLEKAGKPVLPHPSLMHVAQHRWREKDLFSSLGIPTVAYRKVRNVAQLEQAVAEIGLPAVLKTATLGYDGKGQYVLRTPADVAQVISQLEQAEEWILEQYVAYTKEASVIVARNASGEVAVYPVIENFHEQGVLRRSVVPAALPESVAIALQEHARRIAESQQLQGLLTIEFFILPDDEIVANEMAPRPHNSGHWTIEGAVTDQFEQTLRAVLNWPLGDTSLIRPIEMGNILGDEVNHWHTLLSEPHTKLHLYGKQHAVPGRKMGHWTRFL